MKLESAVFFKEIKKIINLNMPFVVYRKPLDKDIIAIVQNSKELVELTNFQASGFVFAPFDRGTKVLFQYDKCDILESTVPTALKFEDSMIGMNSKEIEMNAGKNAHILLIEKALEEITTGHAEKIVVARKEMKLVSDINIVGIFQNMLKHYQNAFVYVWYHPQVGLWIGATPEKLFSIENNKFRAMALAGTQIWNGSLNVNWNKKEKHEQQVVTDFVIANIKDKIKIEDISLPYSMKAGNLLHICTEIRGDLIDSKSIEGLIDSLHPTPATCGFPKDLAKKFILENEGIDRSYYTGYIGELNKNDTTDLFVNLRCMEVKDRQISFFIGGGITKGSDPESEWDETVAKAQIMKSVL